MMKKKKLYVGFLLTKDWSGKINKIQQALPSSRGLRWTGDKNLHLTYFYLGEIIETKVNEISKAMGEVAIKTRPFAINFDKITYAPLDGEPSMIWLLFKFSHEFGFLTKDIKRAAERITVLDEDTKKNIPHVTIARFKGRTPFNLPNLTLKEGEMILDRMVLVESEYRRDELEHRVISEHLFKSYKD